MFKGLLLKMLRRLVCLNIFFFSTRIGSPQYKRRKLPKYHISITRLQTHKSSCQTQRKAQKNINKSHNKLTTVEQSPCFI